MDRSWMRMDRRSFEYSNGVKNFIEFALNNSISSQEKMRCPCLKCGNMKLFSASTVKDHLLTEQFEEFLEDARTPLFPGCNNFTKLSALMRLYNLKAANGWSNKGFSDLLQLLKEMLPAPNQLSISTYEAKKIICKLGMNYEKISACPNDCVLYRNKYIDLNQCPQCGKSR
ncbi:hypothetical protein AXF42_Ash009869 [Apostasia shenzhenica]|uniref:Transposase-associated domain-containing protein n=1 Tax=Apostasia shenzhenica TaxID=1088818 RepID=A0A2I0AC73_9ASPA|nr:hypothetical protein AXF42_Ash009869 [Apostasia shenzhenica]